MNKLEYMLAGRSTFTVVSHVTNKRYTFRVNICPEDKLRYNCDSLHFVSVLAGPDNDSSYIPVAVIFDRTKVWPKGREFQNPVYIAFQWLFNTIKSLNAQGVPHADLPNCEFIPSGRCCRCSRLLTTPESVAAGIGPECATKIAFA